MCNVWEHCQKLKVGYEMFRVGNKKLGTHCTIRKFSSTKCPTPTLCSQPIELPFLSEFIWVLMLLSTHCIGHITTGSFMGRGSQYTYSWSRFCTVNCRPLASNYQLSHLRLGWDLNSDLRGGGQECYLPATMTTPPPHSSMKY